MRVFAESSASNTEWKGTCRMSIFLPSLPEKFSSALQPETLLDLLQIEGMKIEEESEVGWLLSHPLPCQALEREPFGMSTGCLQSWGEGH